MSPIIPQSVYTKTAKGILEARNKAIRLPRELGPVFLSVDGKSTVSDLLERLGIGTTQLHQALNTLVADGYVKIVHASVQAPADSSHEDDVEFSSTQSVSKLNMEAASHALAEAEATKLAQNERRAALDARLRAEAEARARALAEMRAQAEAEARAKAEAAARVAANARAYAEQEARVAAEPAARADAESRARTAASAAIRAEAEARVRTEAEARARALVEEKKAAEESARDEASAHLKGEEQAHARAVAEAGARAALEAQIQAVTTLGERTGADALGAGDAARALLQAREASADRARAAAQAAAGARAAPVEPDIPELQLDDRARQLTARVHSERRARDEAGRRSRQAPPTVNDDSGREIRDPSAFPALELMSDDRDVAPPTPPVHRSSTPEGASDDQGLPTISLAPTTRAGDEKHTTPDHVPSALERAMMQTAARAEAEEARKAQAAAPAQSEPPSASAAPPAPQTGEAAAIAAPAPERSAKPGTGEKVEPTLDDEPLHERLNIDRAAHDILAEAADARKKAEVAELSRSAAAARRQRAEEDARRAATALREKKRRQARTAITVALVGVPALAIAWLQLVPMNSYVPEAQRALSERFNQPTTISTLRYVLLPTPRVVLEGVRIGSAQGIRVARVDAHAWPTEFIGGPMVFSTVDASGVEIDPGMLAAIPSWTGGRSANAVHVNRLRLSGVKLSMPPSTVEGLAGDVTFAPNGTVRKAVLANDAVRLELTPQESGIRVVLNARDWRPPLGFPMNLSHLTLDGIADKQRFSTTELSARIGGGSLTGTLAARWEGPMIVGGQFKLSGARLDEIMPAVVPELAMKGMLSASARYAMQADSATGILGKPMVEGTFEVTRGEVANIDLLRAVQASGGTGRGGRTSFDELKGSVQIAASQYSYRNLHLSSGPLDATGHVEVAPAGQLSGRISAELNSRGSVVARSTLTLTGTLKDPRLTR